ncbi:uncharacterized protein LOC123309995 isoform X2 [Coccinella septempunctata]|nr:uncharacterized protein LOC123309995 isoform X2 [Coccinella septempunctata]XP_044749270.1 uncharacterized protein LOC123309995 isoform X2 [Coccinella septempunctata]
MQVEDPKEAQTFIEIEKKMTCDEMNEAPSLDPNVEPSHISDDMPDEFKFEGINLEDDIERVELSSVGSSDLSSEELIHDPAEIMRHNLSLKDPPQFAGEDLRNWFMKIKEMQSTIYKKMQSEQQTNPVETQPKNFGSLRTPPSRVMKYQDLPYMGEITLDNSKPRRGRKPKKADICHLIYKNYGTILPGTPNANEYIEQSKKSLIDKNNSEKVAQNKIGSSLLEKRLTQEDNKKSKQVKRSGSSKNSVSEPMNLCVRDHNQLKIRLTKNSDDTYTSQVKSEPQSDEELDVNIGNSDNLNDEYGVPQFLLKQFADHTDFPQMPATSSNSPPFCAWPGTESIAGPMSIQEQLMYYQRLASMNGMPVYNSRPPPDILPLESKSKEKKSVIRIKPKECKIEDESDRSSPGKVKRSCSATSEKSPTKRKRSAIFIPPIPTENNTNPATEVSICKFKFTGGAKPSLQEKKMLSVDSGGNFRYYSGTGDKSMRGYEFFPRETLQQTASATQGSSTGAFLQACGEKFFPANELNEKQVKSEFLLSPELPTTSSNSPHQETSTRHKKRKSRKSLQREKLEQTFKEKGFLIQTQQLESAEGATYCKFRQLRKFTRYLFRSWKDYLPGNVQEIQDSARNETDSVDNLSRISPEMT